MRFHNVPAKGWSHAEPWSVSWISLPAQRVSRCRLPPGFPLVILAKISPLPLGPQVPAACLFHDPVFV